MYNSIHTMWLFKESGYVKLVHTITLAFRIIFQNAKISYFTILKIARSASGGVYEC